MNASTKLGLSFLFLLLLVGCTTVVCPCTETPETVPTAQVDFLDGDTFKYNGETVRLLGCDTAEADSPYHRGNQEPWASRGTVFAIAATNDAKVIEVRYADTNDKYGRRLAHLVLDGVPLAVLLVKAGLAYETVSHFGDNGFPEYMKQILAAVGKKPEFQEPYKWRRSHR